jgi:hypothetical protein
MIRWLVPAALLVLIAAPAAAGPPRLLLSWGAPYGQPGARANLEARCDTTGLDTLYMSVDPGKDAPIFLGLDATLYFHPAEGDSLPDFWKSDDYFATGRPVRVIFEEDPERGLLMPWKSPGMGSARYDYTAGSGRLCWLYTIATGATPNPVRGGKPFGVARVLLRRPPPGADGCGRPICIEWSVSRMAYDVHDEPSVKNGVRWVSLNSPGGKVCAEYRDALAPKVSRPKSRPR